MRCKFLPMFMIALFLLSLPLLAQEMAEPTAEFSWPPPVYVLRGEVSLPGTVNLAGMAGYFIEYRPLDEDLTAPATRAWLPVTLPTSIPVVDDVLGTWNTSMVADGLYELRLNVLVAGAEASHTILGPLRVENDRMVEVEPAVTEEMAAEDVTPVSDETPRVTARVNANVREGDSTRFRPIDALLAGESAPILGVSSRGTAWYQIALPNGHRGWISHVVVIVSGATDNLPRIQPPPVPVAIAPPTVVPVGDVDLVAGFMRHNSPDGIIKCGVGFTIEVDVANFGTARSPGGRVRFVDHALRSDGSKLDNYPQEETGHFPPIEPGQTVGAKAELTVSRHVNRRHNIYAYINFDNAIPERTTANNNAQMGPGYKLAPGNC